MIKVFFALVIIFIQSELPLKPKEEFEVKLSYEFKQRITGGENTYDFSNGSAERRDATASGPLPYLSVNVRLIKLPNQEVKMRGVNSKNDTFLNKKITEGEIVKFDLGFTDDLKDRVSSHEYNLLFLSKSKVEINRINFLIEENGTFKINGEVKGKF